MLAILDYLGNSIESVTYLNKTKTQLFASSSYRVMLETADEFYYLNQFEDSMIFYEKIVDSNQINDLTKKLLTSYYKSGELNKGSPNMSKIKAIIRSNKVNNRNGDCN